MAITGPAVCPRCGNDANENYRRYKLFMLQCPHCGLGIFIEIVHKDEEARIDEFKMKGYKQCQVSEGADFVGMKLVVESTVSIIKAKKRGHLVDIETTAHDREFSNADATRLIAELTSDDSLDASKCYLARWDFYEETLDILYGAVPVDSMH